MASSKNNSRASFGSKRPQNGVIRKDGDWICNTCGNLNFAFRMTCNRKYCNASKPSGTLAPKPIIAPVRALQYPLSYNGGVATPPPPPPLYGMAINFGSIPSHISYGSHGTMPRRSFGPRTSIQPATIAPSTYIPPGNFGAIPSIIPYGTFGGILVYPRPNINPYGYGFQGPSSWNVGLTTNSNKNSKSNKRRIEGSDGLSVGDWVCPRCKNVNFAFRTKCNMKKCRIPKPQSCGTSSFS